MGCAAVTAPGRAGVIAKSRSVVRVQAEGREISVEGLPEPMLKEVTQAPASQTGTVARPLTIVSMARSVPTISKLTARAYLARRSSI